MPTSARQIAPLFRKSLAKLRLPNGAMWASPPTRSREDFRNPVGADDSVRPQKNPILRKTMANT